MPHSKPDVPVSSPHVTKGAAVQKPARSKGLKSFIKSHPLAILIIVVVSLGVLGAGLKYLEEDAQKQKLLKPKDRSALSVVNPFLSAPSPTPTPQLSREYLYAGSRLLSVVDANAQEAPPADLAVWRPSNGTWYVYGGPGSQQVEQGWGLNGDKPVPGDYDGDGKTDFSIYRPSEGKWYVINSSDSSWSITDWGLSTDTPAPADYDGDGRTDRAVFRNGTPYTGWYIVNSSTGSSSEILWGITNDKPAPADYDGDGRADLAVWRNSNTNFYSVLTSDGSTPTIDFADSSTEPVSADYDGDGKADYAIKSGNSWIILNSATSATSVTTWQLASDEPVHNDYDGDGKCDIAVWRNSNGYWYIRQSTLIGQSGELRSVQWGLPGDTPVPAYYRR